MYKFGKNFQRYAVDYQKGEGVIVAHSSYFQIWAECGTPALLLYFSLIAGSYVTIWRVRKQARQRYHQSWILTYANMFEASLSAFVVGSAFLNRAHFDLFYHWVALVIMFGVIARREMAEELTNPRHSDGGRGEIAPVEPVGFKRRYRLSGYATGT
jgi:O-antigen ligase